RPRRALPKDIYPESLSRFPLLTRDLLDQTGRQHYDIVVGPESRTLVGLRGPSGIWLHSPKLAGFVRAANQYRRFVSVLDRRRAGRPILVRARELDSQFEWTAHEPAALKEGLEPRIVDVVKRRRPVTGLGKKEALIVSLGRELFRTRKLGSRTFARGIELFGRRGVLELVALIGNYAGTALILAAVDQQLHPEQTPLLPRA